MAEEPAWAAESLPLSASPPLRIRIEIVRARGIESREVTLAEGACVRDAVRSVGLYAEATSALIDDRSVPFDRRLVEGETVRLLRTFSGG